MLPDAKDPWTAPAAPPSDYIISTETTFPKIFGFLKVIHSSAYSPIALDGVIG